MANPRHHSLLRYLRQALGAPAGSGVTDAELLRRFVEERDEAAFELLLWRHAAMVLHVCRQVLRDAEAVEDAFQATFLVFVRKAGSISRKEALGGWLYRVAYHTALKARQQITKRTSAERALERIDPPAAEADDADLRELRRMICEEVSRLPARYRTPIVACFFEGKTHEEAARQLGWPRGTVASRLARGRELLRRRLIRRGVTLPAAAFTAALSVQTSSAALTELIQFTIQTVKIFGSGQSASAALSPHVAALAEGVLKAMYWTRVRIVLVVLLIAGLGGAGTAFWGTQQSEAEPPPRSAAAAPKAPAEEKKDEGARTLARNRAISRLHLRKLALAMQNYSFANKGLPPPAVQGKDGKPLLSWRVLLLPYIGERELYEQFKLSEPWDSPHNKKLLNKMPKVYAPPGVEAPQPFSTFYQVFVSPRPKEGDDGIPAAFSTGQEQLPLPNFPDGVSNTILIVEAGNAVPWTKPEDLSYAADKPLPKLGGLFRDVFHAAFADGNVLVLTKQYNEMALRAAITSMGGEYFNLDDIEAHPPRRIEEKDNKDEGAAAWRRNNEYMRYLVERSRERLRLLKEEREAQRELSAEEKSEPPSDPVLERLKQEYVRLGEEVLKLHKESEAVTAEIRQMQKTPQKKAP